MKNSAQRSSLLQGAFIVFVLCFSVGAQNVRAMSELADGALSGVTGEGIAFGLENFSFEMAPTSFIELTGTAPNAAATAQGWKIGDVRYYGLSLTGNETVAGKDWFGNGCVAGTDGLGCGLGAGTIRDFASVYNPFVLRVFQYPGYDYTGAARTVALANMPTVLEFVGPSASDSWRWSFWGAMNIGRGTTYATSTAAGGCLVAGNGNVGYCGLQSQTIIIGKPITKSGAPSIFRLLPTADTVGNSTLALTYQSALSGNFRFSVQQTTNTNTVGAAQIYRVPDFNDNEGVYFKNVDAFLPMGRLNYQAMTFSRADANGNFVIDLTGLQNNPNMYNDFYCGNQGVACATNTVAIGSQAADPPLYTGGPSGADATSLGAFNMTEIVITSPNVSTHGYVKWGDTSIAAPVATDATNGIYFKNTAGTVTNIGTAELSGLTIQRLKITSLGATP